jgi:integrase
VCHEWLLHGERNRESCSSHKLESQFERENRRTRKRTFSLTERAAQMLKGGKAGSKSPFVSDSPEAAMLGTSLDHQHAAVRDTLKLPMEFVIHGLRHTMVTRLGEAGSLQQNATREKLRKSLN